MVLGVRSAARGRCDSAAARAASAADTGRAELCLKLCVGARGLWSLWPTQMSTAQVNKRIISQADGQWLRPAGNPAEMR